MQCVEQFSKLLDGKTSIADDAAEGKRVDGVVAGIERILAPAVGDNDVLALADHREVSLLEGADGIEMIDAGDLSRQD